MSTPHALLGILAARGNSHGYELKHEYDRRLPGVRPLAFGQMYTTLARLLRNGLIAEAAHQRVSGPDRVSYQLTDDGRTELTGWLSQTVEPAPHVSTQLFVKVLVALLASPDESTARTFLANQRTSHLARMRELTRAKTDPAASVTEAAAADFLLVHLDADVRWMATTLARIGQIRLEVNQ